MFHVLRGQLAQKRTYGQQNWKIHEAPTITHSFLGREVYYHWRFVFGVGWDSIWWFLSGRLSSDSIDGVRYIGQAASRRHVSRCLSARPHDDCLVRHPDILRSWRFFLGNIYSAYICDQAPRKFIIKLLWSIRSSTLSSPWLSTLSRALSAILDMNERQSNWVKAVLVSYVGLLGLQMLRPWLKSDCGWLKRRMIGWWFVVVIFAFQPCD